MKEKIAKWYRQGLWTAKMVQDAVTKGKLTEAEYTELMDMLHPKTEETV